MPIIKSAKKKAKQAIVHRDRNYLTRIALKKAIRLFTDAAKSGNKTEAEKLIPATYKIIDTAAKKKVIEANTAARRKSLLAKMITEIGNKKAEVTKKKKA